MQDGFSHTSSERASLTRERGSATSTPVKRLLATAVSAAIVLAAPASASGAVQLDFRNWKVTTKNEKRHSVNPGGTFRRCGRKVVEVTAIVHYSGATQGTSYKSIWSIDGTDVLTLPGKWPAKSGTRDISIFKEGRSPLDDGKYRLRLRQSGKGLGSSFIKLAPGGNC
jgi:hypothetical protein